MSDSTLTTSASGRCLCGAVTYGVTGELRQVINCHCEQCRRTSGHHVAATAVHPQDLQLWRVDGLRWYRSSDRAERGFCQRCGSSLFWRPASGDRISIMAGSLDSPTGLTTMLNIYVAAAGDYYTIDDTLPQKPQGSELQGPGSP